MSKKNTAATIATIIVAVLAIAEPYNNVPEDGYYTVKSDSYKTFSDIETLVNSTFVEKEAKRILTNINGDDVAVYAEETDDDGNKGIGIDIKMVYT